MTQHSKQVDECENVGERVSAADCSIYLHSIYWESPQQFESCVSSFCSFCECATATTEKAIGNRSIECVYSKCISKVAATMRHCDQDRPLKLRQNKISLRNHVNTVHITVNICIWNHLNCAKVLLVIYIYHKVNLI